VTLILTRASASRPSGECYDVLVDGMVVGRIFKAAASPVGMPWMWTLAFDHEGRTPCGSCVGLRLCHERHPRDFASTIKGLKLVDPFLRVQQVITRNLQAHIPRDVLYERDAIVYCSVPQRRRRLEMFDIPKDSSGLSFVHQHPIACGQIFLMQIAIARPSFRRNRNNMPEDEGDDAIGSGMQTRDFNLVLICPPAPRKRVAIACGSPRPKIHEVHRFLDVLGSCIGRSLCLYLTLGSRDGAGRLDLQTRKERQHIKAQRQAPANPGVWRVVNSWLRVSPVGPWCRQARRKILANRSLADQVSYESGLCRLAAREVGSSNAQSGG
jgi:hypothetical protein